LGDTEVSPINCHETVVEDIPLFLTIKEDLRAGGQGGAGVWGRVWKKKGNFLTPFSLGFLMLANTGTAEWITSRHHKKYHNPRHPHIANKLTTMSLSSAIALMYAQDELFSWTDLPT
jgi:hypothetical protein